MLDHQKHRSRSPLSRGIAEQRIVVRKIEMDTGIENTGKGR
jgi:hypothetical protein